MAGLPRVLIIGCGYLGSRAGALLAARGYRVTGTTRGRGRHEELRALGVEPAVLDLADRRPSPLLDEGWDAAVYAVAAGAGDEELALGEGAAACARRLGEARPPPRSFLYASTTGVYAQSDGSWVDETSPAEPVEARARTIRVAEEDLLALARAGKAPVIILRLAGLYGPGRSPIAWLRRPEMRERVLRGGREAYMNWVRVEDAAAAIALAVERGRVGETYIIAGGEPVRRAEFYRFAAARAGVPAPDLPSRPEDQGKRCSIRKAREELGYAPAFPSWREGLEGLE